MLKTLLIRLFDVLAEDPAQQQFQLQQQHAQMAQQEMNQQAANDALLAADNTIEEVEEDDDAEVDEEGLNAADIEVIINQVRRIECSSMKDAGTDIELA